MNILHKIIEHKKIEIKDQESQIPLDFYKKNCVKSERDFTWNLRWKATISLIAEVKKGSPSAWIIQEDFNIEKIVKLYRKFASCISVLTDEEHFFWSFENLKIARKYSDLPFLCKDFFISKYQVYKARYYWADAILLIAAVLSIEQMQELYNLSLKLWMDAIFEIHDEDDLEKIMKLNWIKIIWINNRNLKTFDIDIWNTVSLAKKISQIQNSEKSNWTKSSDLIIISESWIKSAIDIFPLRWIVDWILVWTSIVWAQNPREKIYELSTLPEIKICWITNIKDAKMAMFFWASYLWVILAESKRRVWIEFLKELWSFVKSEDENVKIVWVFVDEQIKVLKKIIPFIDIIQLHWDEDDNYVEEIREITDKPIWKAVSVKSIKDLDNLPNSCDKILLDTYSEKTKWWTWKSFDWSYILEKQITIKDLVLAWWIGPDNIWEAKRYADIIDLSSGVEDELGVKSKEKIERFFKNLRG